VQRHHTLYFIANPFGEVMLLELLIGGLLWCELLALRLRLAARRSSSKSTAVAIHRQPAEPRQHMLKSEDLHDGFTRQGSERIRDTRAEK
jgi:hypothetical protein